jgi:hypothetical protein
MKRRQFFKLVGGVAAVGVAGALVHDPTDVYTDPYDAFLARVRTQLISLTREHGREVHLMRIDPPQLRKDGRYTRTVRVHLVAGGSLLDRVSFQWDEISESGRD